MNVVWSQYVQGINTLYFSRKLRFDDLFAAQYTSFFQLDAGKNLKFLEIGCGPGALAGALQDLGNIPAVIFVEDAVLNFLRSLNVEHRKNMALLSVPFGGIIVPDFPVRAA